MAGRLSRKRIDAPILRTTRDKVTAIVAPVLLFVIIVGGWQLAFDAKAINRVLFPSPGRIGRAFVKLVSSSYFMGNYTTTLQEIGAGFAIGVTTGLILGTALALSPAVRTVLYPYMIMFQAIPKIILAPVFVVWFGFGLQSKIMMAAAICFFPILVNTLLGLTTVDSQAMQLMRSLRASQLQIALRLRVPGALPAVFAGLKTSLTYAMTGAIVAEFSGALKGIGVLVDTFNTQLQVDYEIAVILTVMILGVAAYIVVEYLDRRIVFWREGDANVGQR
jgi:NitT/TauT family transport system permease protein